MLKVSAGMHLLYRFSMQQAEAGLASEYTKRPHVLRFHAATGEQLLIRTEEEIDMVSWIEHLQASANISQDLDRRPMPRFLTMIRPDRQRATSATLTLASGVQTVVSVCHPRDPVGS